MKKILTYALLTSLALSCALVDKDNSPSPKTYTMTGRADVLARVSYQDESNEMCCRWELGDVVRLKDSNGVGQYDFVVTAVGDDGSATMSYDGAIPDADNFFGTATYMPGHLEKSNTQTANGSTAHMKYGENMVATLDGQKIDGAALVFSHPTTAVYRIILKAPVDIASGTSFTLSGAWNEPLSLDLAFSAQAGEDISLYLIGPGGTLPEGASLKFTIAIKGGSKYSYSFISMRQIVYAPGKYWIADIGSFDMTEDLSISDIAVPGYENETWE